MLQVLVASGPLLHGHLGLGQQEIGQLFEHAVDTSPAAETEAGHVKFKRSAAQAAISQPLAGSLQDVEHVLSCLWPQDNRGPRNQTMPRVMPRQNFSLVKREWPRATNRRNTISRDLISSPAAHTASACSTSLMMSPTAK